MRLLLFLALLEIRAAAAAFHSLRYFYTGSSQVPNFPEFVDVGLVDDVQFIHYDSDSRKYQLKQDWMERVIAEDPGYVERQRQIVFASQQVFKNNIEIAKQRFNQTGGVHTFQRMVGCEWDDETGEVKGYNQYAYDGEDFLAFDLETLTWIAPNPQAVITKHKWDRNEGYNKRQQYYYTQLCPQWLQKYLNYGKSSLLRTELPTVSLLQKEATSPIVCHATGFFPRGAMLFWTKDGEELYEDVDIGQVLPNPDGTFQMMAQLRLSDPSEDWGRYRCVFQLAGVEEDLVTNLSRSAIHSNRKHWNLFPGAGPNENLGAIIGAVVGAVVLLALIGLSVWFFVFKRRSAKAPPSSFINCKEKLRYLSSGVVAPGQLDDQCSDCGNSAKAPPSSFINCKEKLQYLPPGVVAPGQLDDQCSDCGNSDTSSTPSTTSSEEELLPDSRPPSSAMDVLGRLAVGIFPYKRRSAKAPPSSTSTTEEDLPLKQETPPPAPAATA